MRRVMIWFGITGATRRKKIYARACIADCLRRNEAAFSPQLLYLQKDILSPDDDADRKVAFQMGMAWQGVSDLFIRYIDLDDDSDGRLAEACARSAGIPTETRTLPEDLWPQSLRRLR